MKEGARLLMQLQRNNRKGFTAVEIAMVATVIAIIALLILPIFRQRAEDAKEVAAEDELASLVKALLLVEADMPGGNFLPRLNDLDNRQDQIPKVRWNNAASDWEAIPEAEQQRLAASWRGPYIAVKKYETLFVLENTPSPLVTAGVIFIQPLSDPPNFQQDDPEDRYPVDPWGTPYLLFGPQFDESGLVETDYNIRALYSLGADRVPGSGNPTPTNADYNDRELLGTGDDKEFLF